MFQYKRADEVTTSVVFQAFMDGFSDYHLKVSMTEEQFESRFFGHEGNDKKYSFVALEGDKPVGVVLGGIRYWDGLKTLRCGTFCLHPDYRGKGIAQELFERHKQVAVIEKCERMALEVLKVNERAIHFYDKLEYFKAYDMKYYHLPLESAEGEAIHTEMLKCAEQDIGLKLAPVQFEVIEAARQSIAGLHIHWQNETDYYKESPIDLHYQLQEGSMTVGWLSVTPMGKLNFLWVKPECRGKGYGRVAIAQAAKCSGAKQLSIAFVNNGLLEGFVRHMKFQKDAIEQYEMFKLVDTCHVD